ncbi:MAG: type II toxin-antitoxin system RelE/ParE family toxin, partial [Eubacteriales bacterium]|nr:type II toxin-antitoxin system RelE/ParE family toxin [Eubacteriales bacterium]
LFADRYLLIYQIKDNIVYIDAVVDCRQDYIWLIQPL